MEESCGKCTECECNKPKIEGVYSEDTGLAVFMLPVSGPDGSLVKGHCYRAVARPAPSYQGADQSYPDLSLGELRFQNGPIPANGVNGWTNEAVLAAVIDRTERLNAMFPCEENARAIESMKDALQAFNERTAARKARGVEGTNVA